MNLLFPSLRRKAALTAAAAHPGRLARTFVETGDERCPLAGIWSRLDAGPAMNPEPDDPEPDKPEIAWPAMRTLLSWRAFHSLFAILPYPIV